MAETNQGRFVQISNFRNIGVNTKKQLICINRSTKSDYIGNLVLLIGPNNAGKTNILDALNFLNENQFFNSNDLPRSIKNENEGTYVKLFEDPQPDEEIVTKLTTGEKNPPKETFSEWKEGVRRWIESNLDKYMPKFGYKDQLQFIASAIPKIYWNNQEYSLVSNFFKAIDDWTFEEIIKNKWWEKDQGKIEFKTRTPYYNNSVVTAYEPIFNKELIDYLKKLIELENQVVYPLFSHSNKSFNINFYQYHPWKIDNSFFKTKYKGEWNEFFTNLFKELHIKQQDIVHGIWGQQRYYEQVVKDGLKKISNYFNQLFQPCGYSYEFALFFNEETISFEINLVNDKNENEEGTKIIPCIFDEQSNTFKSFFNLYFGLLIGQTHHLRKGDIILMDVPLATLEVNGMVQFRNILKNYSLATGISILLTTTSPFLVDFDYLDEIRLVDNINGIVNITNNFQFNNKLISASLQTIIHSLLTCSSLQFNDLNYTFIIVSDLNAYNYLTGYKLYKIKQLEKEISLASNNEKEALTKLLISYKSLIFIPFDNFEKDFDALKLIFKNLHQGNYKLLINDNLNDEFKNQVISLKELVANLNINTNELSIKSLISKEDLTEFNLNVDVNNINYYNNAITFKYAMMNGQVIKQTLDNFGKLFANLLARIDH